MDERRRRKNKERRRSISFFISSPGALWPAGQCSNSKRWPAGLGDLIYRRSPGNRTGTTQAPGTLCTTACRSSRFVGPVMGTCVSCEQMRSYKTPSRCDPNGFVRRSPESCEDPNRGKYWMIYILTCRLWRLYVHFCFVTWDSSQSQRRMCERHSCLDCEILEVSQRGKTPPSTAKKGHF